MEDDQFYLGVWKLVTAAFGVLVLSISGCTIHQHSTIRLMIEHGANPLAARCAVMSEANSSFCMAVALKAAS